VRGEAARKRPEAPHGVLALRRGVFVTLERGGALRGCLGRITGDRPLGEIVPAMARAAALEDPRFPPVAPEELHELRVEISVLTTLQLLTSSAVGSIVLGRDGLLVRRRQRSGLLLPQVAPEHGWTTEQFLDATCNKAGLPAKAWREPGTEILTFQADVFAE